MNVNQIMEIARNGNRALALLEHESVTLLAKIAIAANNREIAEKEFNNVRASCVGMLGIPKAFECKQYKAADKKLYDVEMALTEALINARANGLFEE